MRPTQAPKRLTPLDVARVMMTFRPINVIAAFYQALANAAANESEVAAKRQDTAQAAKPEEKQEGVAEEPEEEDVIDKVVKLYDAY